MDQTRTFVGTGVCKQMKRCPVRPVLSIMAKGQIGGAFRASNPRKGMYSALTLFQNALQVLDVAKSGTDFLGTLLE
jgi:hypothetical protein